MDERKKDQASPAPFPLCLRNDEHLDRHLLYFSRSKTALDVDFAVRLSRTEAFEAFEASKADLGARGVRSLN